MTTVIVAVAVVVAVAVAVAAFLIISRRRRRAAEAGIRRDRPTVAETSPAARPRPAKRPRLATRLGWLFRREVDEEFWERLEEALIGADVGLATARQVTTQARAADPGSPDEARAAVRDALLECFSDVDRSLRAGAAPTVHVVVGVNGSGKTTTIAKMARLAIDRGESVLVAAADTFRAAAAEQVQEWGSRIGFDVVRGGEGADPASVAFDGLAAARARGRDLVIVDTAGRLHSKQNLMDELRKIVRVLEREGEVSEVLLVLDGSSGQNGIAQARAFTDAVGVTGTVITKLDGTARGGVAVAVERELGIPVKLVGVGEGPRDLLHFDEQSFVDELLGEA